MRKCKGAIKILLRTENGRKVGINKDVVNYIKGEYVKPPEDDRFGALAVFDTIEHAWAFLEDLRRDKIIELWEADYIPAIKRKGLQCPDIDGRKTIEIMSPNIYPFGTSLADEVKILKLVEARKALGVAEWGYDPSGHMRLKPTIWEIMYSDSEGDEVTE